MISISHSEYCTDLGGEVTYKSLDFFELKVIMLTRNEGEALATHAQSNAGMRSDRGRYELLQHELHTCYSI